METWNPEIFLSRCPDHIKSQMKTIEVQAGDYLLHLGDVSRYVYVILEGEFRIFHEMENGNEVYPYVSLYNKEFLGDVEAFIGRDSYIGSNVQAKTNCKLVRMSKDAFVEWVYTDMELNRFIMGRYTKWIHLQSEYGSTQAAFTLRARTARLIEELLNKKPNGKVVSKDLLCGVLAVSQRSFNRIIKQMKDEGIIESTGSGIRVLDMDALIEAKFER